MAIAFFKQHYAQYHAGRLSGTFIAKQPEFTGLEPDLSEENRAQLKGMAVMAAKKRHVSALMSGEAEWHKHYAVTQLAHRTSQVVCVVHCPEWGEKYIGETEKNLHRLFSDARSQSTILFFDEADALFGRRTAFRNRHHQQVEPPIIPSFLSKLLSTYQGLVVFSVNGSDLNQQLIPLFSHHLHFDMSK